MKAGSDGIQLRNRSAQNHEEDSLIHCAHQKKGDGSSLASANAEFYARINILQMRVICIFASAFVGLARCCVWRDCVNLSSTILSQNIIFSTTWLSGCPGHIESSCMTVAGVCS